MTEGLCNETGKAGREGIHPRRAIGKKAVGPVFLGKLPIPQMTIERRESGSPFVVEQIIIAAQEFSCQSINTMKG